MREFLEELKGVTAWSEDLKRDVSTRTARGEELMGYLHRALIHEVTNRIIDRCNQNETTTLGERIAKVGNYRNGHVDDRPQPKYDRTVPATPEVQRSAISRIINFAKNVKNRVERAVIGGISKRQARDFADNGRDVDET